MTEYTTPLFSRLDSKKRESIYHSATVEFSIHGFKGANINTIAEKAGVSVGSLYKYFTTKERLFLATVLQGRRALEAALSSVRDLNAGVLDTFNQLIITLQQHSRRYPEVVNLYNELTTIGAPQLAARLAAEMETLSSAYYTEVLEAALQRGEISSALPPQRLAFFIDNLLLTLQFSYTSSYYRERMKIFLGEGSTNSDEQIRINLLEFIAAALGVSNYE